MTVPEVPWPELADSIRWRQGEHVTIVGPTGCGKTTLAMDLLGHRSFVALLATKPRDRLLDQLGKQPDWSVVRSWPPPAPPALMPKVILWPRWKDSSSTGEQAEVFASALDSMFREGGWCIAADELAYLVRKYRLAAHLEDVWQQGRSLGLSLLGSTQRPAFVPLDMYAQATHFFLFRSTERADLNRLGSISGQVDPSTIRAALPRLRKHEFVYCCASTGQVVRSFTPTP